MILIIGDSHCQYPSINDQIDHAEQQTGSKITSVIQLGDFGIYQKELQKYFNGTKEQCFKRPLYFIDGNHEDFWHFDTLIKKYTKYFTHLPRASVNKIDGYRFLCLGGSAYMDPINTPPGAVITGENIEKCLYHNSQDIDIIISHDCPEGIGVPGTIGFEYCGEPGFPRSREVLDKIKPKLWIFAHHHKWYVAKEQNTQFFGLDVAYNGCAVLDDNFNVTILKHSVNENLGLTQRFHGKEDHLWPVSRRNKWKIKILKLLIKIKLLLKKS
jgi:predicted phosphodiesterase